MRFAAYSDSIRHENAYLSNTSPVLPNRCGMKAEESTSETPCRRIDHIAIAVQDIASSLPLYNLLGFHLRAIDEVESEEVRVAKLDAENVTIELLEPTTDSSSVRKFLDNHGPGLHHFCIEAEDLDQTVDELEQEGYPAIYPSAQPGAEGRNINFLHPSDTGGVLIELQNAPPNETDCPDR